MSNIIKRTFKCTGCGGDRPCIIEVNQTAPNCTEVIAVKERASGNESISTEWIETKSFELDTPVGKILEWAGDYKGRLMISYDE